MNCYISFISNKQPFICYLAYRSLKAKYRCVFKFEYIEQKLYISLNFDICKKLYDAVSEAIEALHSQYYLAYSLWVATTYFSKMYFDIIVLF